MIFEREKINTGRQTEIDLCRGFTAIVVILCHVGLYLGTSENQAIYTFADIIGSETAAPIFMALMGASIHYSRHQDSKSIFLRGVRLFLGGYLLSAYRTLLLRLVFGNVSEWTSIDAFFVVDILQLAGLSFMLFAPLKKLRIPPVIILILSLFMVVVGQIFIANPPHIENTNLIYFLNLFIPITEWSCFPFLTWFFFPAFGLACGEALIHCSNKKKLYGILLPISLCGVLYVYYQFYRFYPAYAENYYFGGNFYYMGIRNVLLTTTFITFALSFWHFVESVLPKSIKKFLTFLGQNLTAFYVFSWIYIAALTVIDSLFSITYSSLMLIVLMVFMVVLCYLSTCFYLKIKSKIRKENRVMN